MKLNLFNLKNSPSFRDHSLHYVNFKMSFYEDCDNLFIF